MASNLQQRIITGIIFIAILVASILAGHIAFICLFSVITAMMLYEFYKLSNENQSTTICTYLHSITGALFFVISSGRLTFIDKSMMLTIGSAYLIILFTSELFKKAENPIKNWAYILLGQIYITLPLILLGLLGLCNGGYNPNLILGLFIVIWLNDTGAYVVGSTIGKHKLFPRVSPKKTWEGFIGGVVVAMTGGYVLSLFMSDLETWQWIAFGGIASIFATLGDLNESLLKRTMGVKDSGNILPGHGGMLDRFDSILLACPAIYFLLSIIL